MSTVHATAETSRAEDARTRSGSAAALRARVPQQRVAPPGSRPRLTVVPGSTARPAAARAPFVLLVCGLLAVGLLSLLLLHTVLAQGSFRIYDLEKRSGQLSGQEAALQQAVAEQAAPQRLAERAEELGMVTSENPAFLRIADAALLGVPAPGRDRPEPPAPERRR
ncbi:MAG: septum formation initiator family protein [Actinomycetota bacterium]|nr:septum formation initiator family protein [Actinomycetota bacterium]